ncbi:MAG: WecB/TagA/CpsF family glycosyltransferase [Hymenobacter sp.]
MTHPLRRGRFRSLSKPFWRLGAARTSAYVCCANVHMLVEAHRDAEFRQVLERADLVTPDGGPVASIAGWRGGHQQGRVAGMDLVPGAAHRGGAARTIGVLLRYHRRRAAKLLWRGPPASCPALRLVGTCAPPFRPSSPDRGSRPRGRHQRGRPRFAVRGPGLPAAGEAGWPPTRAKSRRVCWAWARPFLVYAGLEQRLPVWARRLWLEWAYRLWLEPSPACGGATCSPIPASSTSWPARS